MGQEDNLGVHIQSFGKIGGIAKQLFLGLVRVLAGQCLSRYTLVSDIWKVLKYLDLWKAGDRRNIGI